MNAETGTEAVNPFSSGDMDTTYRPISTMAIVSIVLALLSILAFAAPMFWFVPVVGLFVSALTSRKLEQAKREYAGQLLATCAVVISLISLIAAPTRYGITYYLLTKEARAVLSDRYLDLVLANKAKEAFVLTLAPPNRVGKESKPDELIVRAGNRYREFLNGDVWRALSNKQQEAQVTYVGVTGFDFREGYYGIGHKYHITLDNGEKLEVVIGARGGQALQGEWQGRKWYVEASRVNLITEESS